MKLTSVTCNNCGAPLEVGETSNYVTCSHCGSRLKVERSASAVWTDVIAGQQRIEEKQEDIADDLEVIKAQNELERFDREWDGERTRYYTRTKNGNLREPSGSGCSVAAGAIFMIFFAGIAFAIAGGARSMGAPAIFSLVPLVMVAFAVFAIIGGMKKASTYEKLKSNKEQQRELLVDDLERAKRRADK